MNRSRKIQNDNGTGKIQNDGTFRIRNPVSCTLVLPMTNKGNLPMSLDLFGMHFVPLHHWNPMVANHSPPMVGKPFTVDWREMAVVRGDMYVRPD